ncbi:MAG TPA: amino acid adenylation domain-containing protein [Longimicrobium sp.]|nr:amino acid adenylation domain-containing protein [Longimicrobium sp.]
MSTQDTGARRAALSDTKRALLEARLRGAAPAAAAGLEGVTRCAGPGPEFPASFAQERMWFLSRFAPGTPMYNIPVGMLVPADLDVPALERALTEVVRRHETLRTTYRMGADGQLVQVVQPPQPVPIEVIDVRDRVGEAAGGGTPPLREERAGRGPGGGAPAARISELVAEEGARPFDLERGPMIRITLLRVSDAEHAMVLTTHHIATDGWSMPLLYGDLLAFYEAFRDGRALQLPEPPLRYADYAVWQRERLRGETLEKQVRYWRDLLAGAPALELPTDRSRPATSSGRGRTHHFRLDDALAARVRETCRQQAATVNMVLLAAFAELLRRWSGQDDLVVGTLLGSRSRPELEPIVGMFVNSAALRLRLPADATFRDAVATARRAVLDASRHQDLPFEKLVDELGVPRDLSRHPVFQVLYFHQPNFAAQAAGTDEGDDRPPALPMRPIDPENQANMVDTGAAKFDLQLTTFETSEGVGGMIEYATDLFDDGTVARMARHFATLLRAAVDAPDAPLAALPMMAGAERAAVLAMGAGAERRYEDETLHALFARQAARTPDAVALAFEGRTMTYAELDARSSRLAHRLRRLGVGPEARVGVCMERGMEMVVALLGVLKAGGAYVPLDPEYPRERLAYMLADAAVPVLLTEDRLVHLAEGYAGAIIRLDTPEDDAETPAIPDSLFPVPSPDALAYVIYTSGSTGNPKGAMNAHRGVVNRLRWMQDEYVLAPGDVVLQKTPFSFDVSVWEFFWPLITGARLVLARPGGHRDAAYLAEVIEREGVTTLHFVPSMLAAFVDAAPAERCRTLTRVVCSGEALPEELVQRFYARMDAAGNDRVRLHNLYGPTEAAVDVTYWACERGDTGPVPIGRPVANTRILVLDRRGEPVPVGVPGELHIGGVQVGRGYLGRPALTAEKFVPDPFGEPGARMYRTGDRVRWTESASVRECVSALVGDSRGVDHAQRGQPPFTHALTHSRTHALQFLGRMDFQVKLRGFRIELGEIESLLVRHPSVSAAAAVLRDDGTGPRLVAYVAPREGAAPPAPALLRAHLQQALPEHMVPTVIAVLDALPLTGSGKVDRRALPAPEAEDAGEELVAPRNVVEDMVAEIWAEVLRRERIGVTQNFFALGGHSLLATQVIVRIADAFDVEVPILTFFQDPTVAGLSSAIQEIGSPVLEAMVDELAGLSAEEIEALLAEESA